LDYRSPPRHVQKNPDTLYRSYREEWHRNGEFYHDGHTMSDNDTYDYTTTGNVKLLLKDASPTDVMYTEEGWRISGHLPMLNTEQEQESARNGTFM
jgi:hypothetical protein